MPKFRKKPVEIDAYKFHNRVGPDDRPAWLLEAVRAGRVAFVRRRHGAPYLAIKTLDSTALAELGDWVCRGVKGELYPCKPDIFEATYELVS